MITQKELEKVWNKNKKEIWDSESKEVEFEGKKYSFKYIKDFFTTDGDDREENKIFQVNDQFFIFSSWYTSYDVGGSADSNVGAEIEKKTVTLENVWCYNREDGKVKPIGELI